MRAFGRLVFSLFFLGLFLGELPLAFASEGSHESSKPRFLLVQYQRLENGYDPQAIMDSWTGKVLNEQTQMRESPQSASPYGNGTREYAESSFVYPSQAQGPVSGLPNSTPSVRPGVQFQSPYPAPQQASPYPPSYSVPPAYGPQPYGPSPYGAYPQGPSPYQMPNSGGYGQQPGFYPYPTNPQPSYRPPAPYQPMYPQTPPPGNCFCG